MPLPKSVTKINKGGVSFTSSVDKAAYTIDELTRAGLKDVAKVLRREVKSSVPVRTGILKKTVSTWVRKNPETKQLSLQIGVYSAKKAKEKGIRPAPHAHLVHNGTIKMGKRPFITESVTSNIALIRQIETQYLSKIANEIEAEAIINEDDEESND